MKRILALFLSAVLAVGLFAVPGFAAEPEEIPDPAPSGFTNSEEPRKPHLDLDLIYPTMPKDAQKPSGDTL